MFQSIGKIFKLPEELKQAKSYKDLKRIFRIKELLFKFTCIPKKLVFDISISCEAKIFWAIIHQLCGLGCSYYKQEDLSKIMGVTVRTIQNYQTELKKTGWLKVKRCNDDNRVIEYVTKSSGIYVAILNKYLFNFSISPQAKNLWLILQELGDESGCSWYGLKKLAKLYGCKDKETLKKYRDELVKAGWLKLEPSARHRGKDYVVIWPENRPNPKLISAKKKSKSMEKSR